MPAGNLKAEYLDASANQRQFQILRFARLTVFLAISGFLVNALFNPTIPLSEFGRKILSAGGFLRSLLF